MNTKTKVIFGIVVLCISSFAAGTYYVFTPKTFADCLLKNQDGDRFLVREACRAKFPKYTFTEEEIEEFSHFVNPFADK